MVEKKCKTCNTVYEAEDKDGLSKYFYIKDKVRGGWLRNTCKKCECEDHAKKYANGKYNYTSKTEGYAKQFTLGYF